MADKVRIEINRSTREAMNGIGTQGDTYDSLIVAMIDQYKIYTTFKNKYDDDHLDD